MMKATRWKGALLAAVVSGAATVAVGPPLATAGATPAQAGPTSYVALGDSYTSGGAVPLQLTDPVGCWRSDHNWPHLVFPATGATELRDRTCSGADSENMTEAQDTGLGTNPPQFDAIDASTTLVSLQIGGNDIGFSDIVENCAMSLTPFGSPCKNHYVVNGVDEISRRINSASAEISADLDGIAARSPGARVVVVGYPSLVPDSGSGCWPSLAVAWKDVPYLRAKTKELNGMIAAQAAAHGAQFVDLYGPSIGKDACASSSVRWVEPLIPANWGAPFHPNDRGHRGMATVIRAAL
jgi:lysophospholipase L1-like esterase